jgi:hypothetical protein
MMDYYEVNLIQTKDNDANAILMVLMISSICTQC